MWSPRLINVETKIAFGQLILRKIIKTVATRCQILRPKCTKIQNSAELIALPPEPLAGFKGPTSKGREWRGWEGKGWEGDGKGREGERRGVLWSPKIP